MKPINCDIVKMTNSPGGDYQKNDRGARRTF